MGALIDALTAKYAAENPPLDVSAGVLQTTELDAESNLAFADVDEAHAYISERLAARENEAMVVLNQGQFPFPVPDNLLSSAFLNRTADQAMSMAEYQLNTAAEAVEKYVLGDLFLKASNRNPELYLTRAMFYLGDKTTGRRGEADLLLQKALDSVLAMGQDPTPPATRSRNLKSATFGRSEDAISEYGGDRDCIGRGVDYRDPSNPLVGGYGPPYGF